MCWVFEYFFHILFIHLVRLQKVMTNNLYAVFLTLLRSYLEMASKSSTVPATTACFTTEETPAGGPDGLCSIRTEDSYTLSWELITMTHGQKIQLRWKPRNLGDIGASSVIRCPSPTNRQGTSTTRSRHMMCNTGSSSGDYRASQLFESATISLGNRQSSSRYYTTTLRRECGSAEIAKTDNTHTYATRILPRRYEIHTLKKILGVRANGRLTSY